MKPRIIIAGGAGFLGQALARRFSKQKMEVFVLSRSPSWRSDRVREIAWDAKSLGDWAELVDGAEAVINLTGKSVDCRYHEKNRREIIASRVDSTRILGEAIARCTHPPRVWLNASSATIYKHTYDQPMNESGQTGMTPEAKDGFSIEVIQRWERALAEAHTPATRKVALRTGLVLGRDGGAFPVFRRLAKLGLGGTMAGGRQWFSWIHEEDFCRAIECLLERNHFAGAINITAPHPLSNRETLRLIRESCGRTFGLPASRWMLEVGAFFLRTETELLLKSRYVVPGTLLSWGFQFKFPELPSALADLCAQISDP